MSNKEIKEKALIEWSSFPLLDYPKKSVLLIVLLFFIAYVLWNVTIVKWQQPLYYVLGVIILFIGIIPYFVSTKYEFYEDKFIVRYPFVKIEKKYSDYGSFYNDKNGVMISTFKQVSRLDAFRGQSVRFSKSRAEKEQIIEFLSTKLIKL